jgi:cellulose synthase/poly-beta-1,6-N-acetylglucosamine synthase-like glycosyltransferase
MFDDIVLVVSISSVSLLCLSTLGYILILRLIVLLKPRYPHEHVECPDIAVMIPALNEEDRILQKMRDMEHCDYPQDRMKLVVMDEGSTDRTAKLVREEISRGKRIKLICLNDSKSKVDQVNHVLTNLGEETIVFTDVDSRLAPSCIRELVQVIKNDPETALVGASVIPRSGLLEERIHWHFLNCIWWLEGEVFAAAGISGVCHAVNRKVFGSISQDAMAEDIHLGLDISVRGYQVRICPWARAFEMRVPQTAREFVQFRRRRGFSYLNEPVNSPPHPNPPLRWRLAKFIRLWQFAWLSRLGLIAVLAACLLAFTWFRMFLIMFLVMFGFSTVLQVSLLSNPSEDKPGIIELSLAMFRFSLLTLFSLVSLYKAPSLLGAIGGKEGRYDQSPAA